MSRKSACKDRSSLGSISRFVSARQLDLIYDRDSANINETALFHLSLSDGFSVWAIFIIAGGGFGAPWKREFRAGWTDTRLPRGGHDLPAFQSQTPTAFDSGFTHAICEGPCVYDPPRVRASRDRACRQSRDPHQRHGRDGGAADRSKQTVLIPRRQCPRTAPSRVRRRGNERGRSPLVKSKISIRDNRGGKRRDGHMSRHRGKAIWQTGRQSLLPRTTRAIALMKRDASMTSFVFLALFCTKDTKLKPGWP